MWASWVCRNKILFEQECPHFGLVTAGFVKLIEDYCSYAKKVFMPITRRKIRSPSSWTYPSSGCVKYNTYAYFIRIVACALGVVIRDDREELLINISKRMVAGSAEMAETMAVRYEIQIAKRFGYQNIIVETDSWNMVNNVRGWLIGYTPNHLFYKDINMTRLYFNSFTISHVKRVGNNVAHCVAI
ncbi:uncharacterized protein LOC141712881 [Apium graveolens]|uniref:uncharacterized protein LOC141712881 n=1 Tax=Apium graveolens TaxID=4045 RepID=UPI003D795A7F